MITFGIPVIDVEVKLYALVFSCDFQPCPAWNLGDAWCFMCDQKCEEMHAVANPRSDKLEIQAFRKCNECNDSSQNV